MGRKEKGKRQKDPAADEFESSEEDEQKENELREKTCPHVGKAVNFNNIRKTLKISWVRVGQCTVCLRDKKTTTSSTTKTLTNASARKSGGGFKKSLDAADAKKQQAERLKAEQLAAAKAQQLAAVKLAEQKREKTLHTTKVIEAVKNEKNDGEVIKDKKDEVKEKTTEEKIVHLESDTKDNKDVTEKKAEVKPEEVHTTWLCLKCGTQGCGDNSPSNHSLAHYKTPRSDLHCLVINPKSWVIWCYECNSDVFADSHKKLYESLEFIKKTSELPSKQPLVPKPKNLPLPKQDLKNNIIKPPGSNPAATLDNPLPRVKGLSNLGNTCFFNAVMQCLAQTHCLETFVGGQCLKGVSLSIPGVILPPIVDNDEDDCYKLLSTPPTNRKDSQSLIWLEDLNLKLAEGGPMTSALAAFFREMSQTSKVVTVNPGHLFGQLVKRAPQFRGFQQQDSHELLRHLMEGLRTEESKRQKSAILKHFGLSERTDPKSVVAVTRKKLQAYSRHASHTVFDRIFSGQMVSTVVCDECKHSSHIYESFLDLSLPVIEDKPHKPAKRSSGTSSPAKKISGTNSLDSVVVSGFAEERKSKTQTKNQKKRAKQERRRNSKNNKTSVTEIGDGDESKITQDIEEKEVEDEKKDIHAGSNKEPLIKEKNEGDEESKPLEEVLEETRSKVMDKMKGALDQRKDALDKKKDGLDKKESSEITKPIELEFNDQGVMSAVALKAAAFNTQAIADAAKKSKVKGGGKPGVTVWKDKFGDDEEDEEEDGDGYEEDDWEWDYGEGEQWDETGDKESDNTKEDSPSIDTSAADNINEPDIKKPLVSLNPLPPESLNLFEREKSSEPEHNESDDDDETGASSNGDVEDNDTEEDDKAPVYSENTEDMLNTLAVLDPLQLRKDSMAPHMQELCSSISGLTISEGVIHRQSSVKNAEMQQLRLRHEWTARTLTSLAPRYQVSPGECSVYSCLNQFTQSELLTGSNKWACERCSILAARQAEPTESQDKPKPVYSNAFKQLLIFCPPAILTLHLKRFQQTLSGCRKINKDITFPMELDLAPFCSSTSVATPTVAPNHHSVMYRLYGVVEHSGRLSGGHYTAFVKVRVTDKAELSKKFFSPPATKAGDVPRLLEEIERKFTRLSEKNDRRHGKKEEEEENPPKPQPRRWYHVSDSSVNEVSEEKVLKAQAYILFYERTS